MKKINEIFSINNVKRIKFREDINGLRAIAVLSVVFYHIEIDLFKGGWLGVDVFFVISGYLISNIIISELINNEFSFREFYLRRVNRILPALFFVLLISIPFSMSILSPKAFNEFSQSLLSSIFFYANYHFRNLDFYISEPSKYSPLLHTWSLAIEEQFYILFPLVVVILFKLVKNRLTYFITLFIFISIYLNSTDQSYDKFYGLQFRIWELLLGVLIMIISSNIEIKNLQNFGILLIFFSIYFFDDSWINDIEPKLISLFGTVLILFSNTNETLLSKFLSIKVFKYIGLSSFSLYLLHQPFFAFYRIVKENNETSLVAFDYYQPNFYENFFIFFINTNYPKTFLTIFLILFSLIIYEFIEKSFINNKITFFNKKIFFISLFCLFGLFFFTKDKYSEYPTIKLSDYAEEEVVESGICWNEKPSYECLSGDSNEIIYLIGDSQFAKVSKILSENNKNYSYFFNINPYGIDFFNNFYSDKCTDCLLDYLNLEKEKKTIIFNARIPHYIEDSYFFNGKYTVKNKISKIYPEENFIRDINTLIDASDLFILIYPIPEHGWNARDLIINKRINKLDSQKNLSYERKYWDSYSSSATDILNSLNSEKIKRIYPSEIFCNQFITNECVAEFNNNYFYLDGFHLSSAGAEIIVREIEKLLLIEDKNSS
tara:strand:- start:132 stop:2111 length:1980 start_codon:yes stop_codon:yes gene_type:complete